MTVNEFYNKIGGSYEQAKERLMNDALIGKFVKKFPEDPNMPLIKNALESKDYDTAFGASHTLKGVSLNLSFTKLSNCMVTLTDMLRDCNRSGLNEENLAFAFGNAEKAYYEVIEAIKELS